MHSLTRIALALVMLGWTADAHASNADRCAESAERGQAAWKKKQLLVARTELRACGTSKCPRVVRDDCAVWAGQVEDAIPTVVFSAHGERGEDLTAFELTIDGARTAYPLGSALELDPGEHLARIADGVHAPVERTFVLREGEKRRVIDVRFAPASSGRPAEKPAEPPRETERKSAPASAWVVGGLGVAALGGFGFLGITGLHRYGDLRDECRVTRVCTDSEISSTRTQLWIADGLGLAGAIALAAAIWLYVDR